MWIQVRSMDGKQSVHVRGISKLLKIEDLRKILVKDFDIPPERQRLFYRGKQMEDGHSLFDYSVGLNDIVQMLIRPLDGDSPVKSATENGSDCNKKDGKSMSNKENQSDSRNGHQDDTGNVSSGKYDPNGDDSEESIPNCCYYKVGDLIDCRDKVIGAWFEGKIIEIRKKKKEILSESNCVNTENEPRSSNHLESTSSRRSSINKERFDYINSDKPSILKAKVTSLKQEITSQAKNMNDYSYIVSYEGYEDDESVKVQFKDIRPRARTIIPYRKLKVGDYIMANYNLDDHKKRGYWYDAQVTSNRNASAPIVTLFVGSESSPLENCQLHFIHELFAIEKPIDIKCRGDVVDYMMQKWSPAKRQNKPNCSHCQDNERRKCKFCACNECGGKNDPSKQILCDECDMAYHIWCLNPPLNDIPNEDEWYCPQCKIDKTEVIHAGEKLKDSKKKAKMASSVSSCTRDWGKGMACVGRTKQCTIVPSNHFGPIPGVEVGTLWKFRVQVSEAGIHRPHVAGIHGRESDGAYSIVLAGGYEDDVDDGDEFTYTGSGGRDLSGNKRTAEQSYDQTLTRMNKALALNCAASLSQKGAEAKNWKDGKPVRVVRSSKGKSSSYSPEDGNRYDGIYKVVKYWPEKGKSGFLVWRYLLRRDDQSPSPWSKAGKIRIKKFGLTMQYPDGYLEACEMKEKEEKQSKKTDKEKQLSTAGKKKRSLEEIPSTPSSSKKLKTLDLPNIVSDLIENDSCNKGLWLECKEYLCEGMQKFISKVEELFMCICCQEVVFMPITTECNHNICKSCLMRSFKAEVFTCPACRHELGKDYKIVVNKILREILQSLLPGYENGRE